MRFCGTRRKMHSDSLESKNNFPPGPPKIAKTWLPRSRENAPKTASAKVIVSGREDDVFSPGLSRNVAELDGDPAINCRCGGEAH